MSEHLIQLDHVFFQYPDERAKALFDVSLAFDKGEVCMIEGPNGCGKSTLFRILLGLDFPVKGHCYFDGQEVTKESMKNQSFSSHLHRSIGYLFQNSEAQLFTRSVAEEIAFGLEQMGLSRTEVRKRVREYACQFGLDTILQRAPFNISGGEKKRTALAAVCAMEPEILIMDEPLSGLDEESRDMVMKYIHSHHSDDRLFIIAEHSEKMEQEADRIITMGKNHCIISDRQNHAARCSMPAKDESI